MGSLLRMANRSASTLNWPLSTSVTDPYNRLVTGLDADNFRVFEDNVEQEVVNFSSEDVPISIGVIFDHSGSMADKLGKAKEAAIQFFKTANPQEIGRASCREKCRSRWSPYH